MGKTHSFNARSRMPVSAEELFAWHARPGALERLLPPWQRAELVERTGDGIHEGARVRMRVWTGPLAHEWVAEHTRYVEGALFQDVMRSGPFESWVHTHRLWPEPPQACVLEDEVEYALPMGTLGERAGGAYAHGQLERMFAYRHAVTRADVERHAAYRSHAPLRVAVSGASGLVGASLVPFLTTGGHAVRSLVRGGAGGPGQVRWSPEAGEVDTAALEGVDALVHLAGEPVAAGRWTPARKERIRRSRERGTRVLAEALARMARPPRVMVSASAIGYYGSRGDEALSESAPPGDDFLAQVCREWEAATRPAEEAGVRVVHLRIGVVLSGRGGALGKMLPAFRAGTGGPIGPGTQWVSWVSLEDVLGLVQLALLDERVRGPLNAVAPGALHQADFARTLGRVLGRPAVLPLPAAAVRALFGEMGETVLLGGQRVEPVAAAAHGFRFLHPELEGALRFHLGRTREGPQFSATTST